MLESVSLEKALCIEECVLVVILPSEDPNLATRLNVVNFGDQHKPRTILEVHRCPC